MCTVTFIPVKNNYIITSNRDEKYSREKAVIPTIYSTGGNKILYPKDGNEGGTWIALHENGNAVVLLNGAFVNHVNKRPYKKSRGIVLLEIINAVMPLRFFTKRDLSGIEPFTMILFDDYSLYECRWDGHQKHCCQLRKNHHYIWSSATLYSKEVARKREQCFAGFLNQHSRPNQEDILRFHQSAGIGNIKNDLKTEHKRIISTVSVTSISIGNETGNMKYLDLKTHQMWEAEITFLYSLHDEAIY